MKKQQIRSKASELQQRLMTKETYHLVNSKKFGTAASRNERQLEKKIRCLHTQQAKTLAKLRDEIYDVKIRHKMLKEVDETTRDPRTTAEKTAKKLEESVDSDYLGNSINMGKLNLRKSDNAVIIRNHPTGGRIARSMGVLPIKKDRSNTIASPFPTNDPKVASRIRVGTITEGPKPTFLCGILDMDVKRDASIIRRYNFKCADKSSSQQNLPEIAKNTKPSHVSGNTRVNCPQLNCDVGKKNRRTTGVAEGRPRAEATTKPSGDEETSRIGQRIYAPALQAVNNEGKAVHHRRRRVRAPVCTARETGVENDISSSSDDAGPEEQQSPTEDWGAMLRKCRYLRKPKGHETPEEPIEAVFR